MYKFRAKVLISKKPSCNCGGFYHPGDKFTETNFQTAKHYIAKGWVDVLEEPQSVTTRAAEEIQPVEVKEEKKARKTKELKG